MKWINDPRAVVRFGDVTLHEPARTRSWHDPADPFPFQFVVLSDGATFGDPEPESTEIPSALLDGTIVTTTRNNNRVVELTIGVVSESGEGLARGERVLMGECNKARGALRRNSLTWLPPQPSARTTVYEVLEAHLEWPFDDEAEMLKRRLYRLVLTCAPFARGAEEIVTPAVDVGTAPVFEVVDDGSSTTSWSATVGGDSVPVEGPPPGVTVEPLRTNLVENGTFRLTSAPWRASTGSGSVTRRESAGGRSGGVLDVEAGWGTNFGTVKWSYASPGVGFPIAAGQRVDVRYKYRFQNDPEEGPMPAGFLYRYRNASRGQIGADQFHSATPFSGTAWRDVAVKLPAAPAGAATVQVIPRLGASYTVAGRWYIDDFMVATSTHSTIVGEYFDGDTPESSEGSYWWTGAPYASTSVAGPPGPTALTRTGTVDFTGTPYLHVDYTSQEKITASIDGGEALQPISTMAMGGGKRRASFDPGVTSASSVTIIAGNADGAAPSLVVHQVQRATVETPVVSTGRLASRAIDVRGTARAPASLELAHPTDGLGDVVLYTYEEDDSGYRPDLRRFWVSGGTVVADPTASSGQRSEMTSGTPEVFEMPVDQLPDGVYEILAFVARTGTAARTFTWTTSVRMPGDTVDYGTYSMFKHITPVGMGGDGDWVTASLGLVSLPSVAARAGVVRLAVSVASDDTYLDDVLLCNVTTGDLTRVSAGDHKRLWVDSPTLDVPRRTIWLGNAEDRSDARHATSSEIEAWGAHQFLPGTVAATVKTDAISAGLSMRQYEWFMHNASTYDDEDV